MAVVLNPFAGGGLATTRWESIKDQMPSPYIVINLPKIQHLHDHLSEAYLSGIRTFIAAGGDGTVNLLSQTLIERFNEHKLQEVSLGAIGIGSSNDYHKPMAQTSCIHGYPCRLNVNQIQKRDLLKLTLSTNHREHQRVALLNASCGITAKANELFNTHAPILRFLKKVSINLAILFTAIQSICTYRNQSMTIATDETTLHYPITNIGITKSPFFTGEFAYEDQFIPDDGSYSVYICHNMNVWDVMKRLFRLKKHQFISDKKALCIKLNEASTVKIFSNNLFPFEFDGETAWVNSVTITMMKQCIRCCT